MVLAGLPNDQRMLRAVRGAEAGLVGRVPPVAPWRRWAAALHTGDRQPASRADDGRTNGKAAAVDDASLCGLQDVDVADDSRQCDDGRRNIARSRCREATPVRQVAWTDRTPKGVWLSLMVTPSRMPPGSLRLNRMMPDLDASSQPCIVNMLVRSATGSAGQRTRSTQRDLRERTTKNVSSSYRS